MSFEQGNLSIDSDNIFPIIKKWLYSDHDIFFRELVSNGCDAVTKLKKLALIGEAELPEDEAFRIDVSVSAADKTITFRDNGIGMTADEVKEYINRIAFSGAADFLAKYKDKATEDQIIGHFGLGFYSAFMVASKVVIRTKSFREGTDAVYWESEGGTTFSMSEGNKEDRGTEITLYLADDSSEFANEWRAKEILEKYCSFMPVPIYFTNEDTVKKEAEKAAEEKKEGEEKAKEEPKPLNDPEPLWLKNPNECKEEDYKALYTKLFRDFKEPLFYIHLNMDYPFRLKGILYFPKLNLEVEPAGGTIKLYSNQVFIADNIKEVIPEFLLLLKGVIDCADLPLNVSRSALQNDGFVKKISEYITKKVADKLTGMFKVDRENYEKYWGDIHPFIKYGCLRDTKFSEKLKSAIIYKNLEGKYVSLDEYLQPVKKEEAKTEEGEIVEVEPADENEAEGNDKRKVIYYVTDEAQQGQYIRILKDNGLDALYFTHSIDEPFISKLEQQYTDYRFARVDSVIDEAVTETLSEEEAKSLAETLTPVFTKALGKEKLELKVNRMKDESVAAVMTLSEETRRMNEMMKMYGMKMDEMPETATLVLNSKNNLVRYLLEEPEGTYAGDVAQELYDLAMLAHKPLTADAMTAFVARTQKLLGKLVE